MTRAEAIFAAFSIVVFVMGAVLLMLSILYGWPTR
jgi:hypothetical protein